MLYLIILILVIVILFLVWKGFLGKRAVKPPPTPPIPHSQASEGTRGEAVEGICAVAVGRDKVKEENKQKILDFLGQKGRANNTDIRELLGIADRTAVDYMDELEKEGKVRQVGETGRWTHYELK
jgi:hypothetical protein